MQYRMGDKSERAWYRSDRFFSINGLWFFTTREKIDMGPFMSRKEAEIELARFIRHITDSNGLCLSQYNQSFLTGHTLKIL
jgi:hypothetical protein